MVVVRDEDVNSLGLITNVLLMKGATREYMNRHDNSSIPVLRYKDSSSNIAIGSILLRRRILLVVQSVKYATLKV